MYSTPYLCLCELKTSLSYFSATTYHNFYLEVSRCDLLRLLEYFSVSLFSKFLSARSVKNVFAQTKRLTIGLYSSANAAATWTIAWFAFRVVDRPRFLTVAQSLVSFTAIYHASVTEAIFPPPGISSSSSIGQPVLHLAI
jgi:hypothetical protein